MDLPPAGSDKERLAGDVVPNLGIITAYNDMLSAHQPYRDLSGADPRGAREVGAVAQVAGGVPAMCDGVTQGQDRHGAVAVLARRHRHGRRRRPVAPDVRRRRLPRHLRQDRARV
jgi:dihydroxyacid dehydratase/phosphogluconate dehydratase